MAAARVAEVEAEVVVRVVVMAPAPESERAPVPAAALVKASRSREGRPARTAARQKLVAANRPDRPSGRPASDTRKQLQESAVAQRRSGTAADVRPSSDLSAPGGRYFDGASL
jgi:hypothetical protein